MSVDNGDADGITIERRDDGIAGIWVDGVPIGKIVHRNRERIEELERENHQLREKLEQARADAKLALNSTREEDEND